MAKKTKMEAVRERTDEQLVKREQEIADQLFKLRFQIATGQNENPSRVRSARRDLARVKTALSERRLAGSAGASTPAAKAKE